MSYTAFTFVAGKVNLEVCNLAFRKESNRIGRRGRIRGGGLRETCVSERGDVEEHEVNGGGGFRERVAKVLIMTDRTGDAG